MSKDERMTAEHLVKKGYVPDGRGGWCRPTATEAKQIGYSGPSIVERMATAQEDIRVAKDKITAAVKKLKPLNVRTVQDFKPPHDEAVPYENRKIKGATKSEVDGVKFDSQLEQFMYALLKGAGIGFDFQKEYVLQEKFRYNGKAIRSIKIIVDFWLPERRMIIDTKGWQTYDGKIKYKMFKWYLHQKYEHHHQGVPVIEMPATKEECRLLLNRLLFDNKVNP